MVQFSCHDNKLHCLTRQLFSEEFKLFSHFTFDLIMVALWNRADHYIIHHVVSFYLSSIFYLFPSPNLSSRTLDVYHRLLPHRVWPYCEFRMQV